MPCRTGLNHQSEEIEIMSDTSSDAAEFMDPIRWWELNIAGKYASTSEVTDALSKEIEKLAV